MPTQNIEVKINRSTGRVEVWAEKTVISKPADPKQEISLTEAKKIKSDVKLGDLIMVESTPQDAGRIAAQTAKQVILQRLHEAEHSAIFEEYAGKSGDIVSGVIQRIEPRQVLIDLGRVERFYHRTNGCPMNATASGSGSRSTWWKSRRRPAAAGHCFPFPSGTAQAVI